MTDVRNMRTSDLIIRICDSAIDYGREKMIYELDRRIPVPSAQPAPVSWWQPIESAPTNGERVLVVRKALGAHPEIGWWDAAGLWRRDDDARLVGPFAPTHWMPLPEVPR